MSAAFIGPGTVTACTLAGANFGFALIWALVFATIATIVLQDMAARLGGAAQLGLGEALMRTLPSASLKWAVGALIVIALFVGNSAYQAGNLTGAALGLAAILGDDVNHRKLLVAGIALLAGLAVMLGRYAILERILIALVVVMAAAFAASFILVRPNLSAILAGLAPTIPDEATLTVVALLGTTIVPYNLFLHAAAAKRKWSPGEGAKTARVEGAVSIGLGGLVSIFIMSTAAGAIFQSGLDVRSAADMAAAIEPTFGVAARYILGVGMLAAGLTSAITAPMATAFALTELAGGGAGEGRQFRAIGVLVVVVGAGISLLEINPVVLIVLAQYANGLLLPFIGMFLLIVMNTKSVLGAHTNSTLANLAGGAVVLITLAIGLRSVLRAAGIFP